MNKDIYEYISRRHEISQRAQDNIVWAWHYCVSYGVFALQDCSDNYCTFLCTTVLSTARWTLMVCLH